MIVAEAIEGGHRDDFFDESRNREFIPPEPKCEPPQTKTKLPPIRYNLELIKQPDGSYEWVE